MVSDRLVRGRQPRTEWSARIGGAAAYWVSVALGAVTLVLVVVNVVVLSTNRSIQAEVNQRQQYINQSNQLSRVDEVLIRTIATAAVNAKDDKLRDLLAQQGVTMTVNPSGSGAAPGSPVPAAAAPAPAATSGGKAP
jgi:heme exporter protein D